MKTSHEVFIYQITLLMAAIEELAAARRGSYTLSPEENHLPREDPLIRKKAVEIHA